MREYSVTCRSYEIGELPEKAQQHAYEKWLSHRDYPWASENRNTLDVFCKLFDVNVYNWSYDSYNYNFSFRFTRDIPDVSGIRLAVYVHNNYGHAVEKGKYYSKSRWENGKFVCKHRHSRVTKERCCVLTGYCIDEAIMEPIYKCMDYKRIYSDYDELIDECLNAFFKECCKDSEYCESQECFLENDDNEYDEDGNIFRLPSGYTAA